MNRVRTPGLRAALLLVGALSLRPGSVEAQEAQLHACVIPGTGTLYLIKRPGLPEACVRSEHVECPWIELPDELARQCRASATAGRARQAPDEAGGGRLEREPGTHPGEGSRSVPLCPRCKISVMF